MKKLLSLVLIFILLCSLPFAAVAQDEQDFSFTPPTKRIYYVGDTPDYTGGQVNYSNYQFSLSEANCSGLETALPGRKIVTVSVMLSSPKAYFDIIVLRKDEPIAAMKDIFSDDWCFTAFGVTMKAGFINGDAEGTLRPYASISRAELAALLHRAYKNDFLVLAEKDSAAKPFEDVSAESWYYGDVEACRKAGLIRGVDDAHFEPDAPISRQDAILMMMRINHSDEELSAVDIQKAITESGLSPKDFNETNDYAKGAMALALGNILRGDEKGYLHPQDAISRAECATIFQRLFLADYVWEDPPQMERPKPEPKPEPKPDPSTMPLIFLSPSSQFENRYAAGNTTEGKQMNLLAEVIKTKLEAAGYRVYLPSSDTTYQERAALSNEVGADIHIPLHSNAGGGSGTIIFYNGKINGSKELSNEIFARLGALTQTPADSNHIKDDSKASTPFHEIRVPKAEMAYIEVDFHDKPDRALWIINNRDAIAQAITEGIIAYCEKYPHNFK